MKALVRINKTIEFIVEASIRSQIETWADSITQAKAKELIKTVGEWENNEIIQIPDEAKADYKIEDK